jgi:hypothetical protein
LSRFRPLLLFATLTALAVAFVACGGGGSDDPQAIVDDSTLQGIESGEVDLSLAVDAKGKRGGHVDVSLNGPFQGESEEDLPELDLSAQAKGSLGGEAIDFDAGLVLLGNKAYVAYEGTDYEVDATTFSFVRSTLRQQGSGSSEAPACQDAVAELEPGNFIDGLTDEGGADVGGTDTTKVSGDLDVPAAIEAFSDLLDEPACSQQLDAAGPVPSTAELDEAADTVRDSVKSAHVELYVGEDDIIRRIAGQVTIEPSAAGGEEKVKRADVDFDLTLTGVNEDQTIEAPRSSRPLSALFIKLGINPLELLGALQGGGGEGGGGLGGLLEGLEDLEGFGGVQ